MRKSWTESKSVCPESGQVDFQLNWGIGHCLPVQKSLNSNHGMQCCKLIGRTSRLFLIITSAFSLKKLEYFVLVDYYKKLEYLWGANLSLQAWARLALSPGGLSETSSFAAWKAQEAFWVRLGDVSDCRAELNVVDPMQTRWAKTSVLQEAPALDTKCTDR